jgi:hypothetical protein
MLRGASQSVSRKLTTMNIMVSGAALVLACVAFLAYDQLSFRQDLSANAGRSSQNHRFQQRERPGIQ